MGRKAGGKDFAPRVRSLFDIALKELLASGKLLPKLKEQLLSDPAGTFRAMSAYAPKQVELSVNNEDAPGIVDAVDWDVLRAAKAQEELKRGETTH